MSDIVTGSLGEHREPRSFGRAIASEPDNRFVAPSPSNPSYGELTHATCIDLSRLVRGRLCEQLAAGPGRSVGTGELLYTMGQPAQSLFLVRRGLVKTSLVSEDGQELTLRLHPPGEIVGELCICSVERREQAVALVASELVEIPAVALLRRIREDPETALQFASVMCAHLGDAYEGLRSRSFDPVSERLARTLLLLAEQLGEAGTRGIRIGHFITQEELARLIGARREVVSGLLNRLRTEGIIRYTRRGPIEVDREALMAYVKSISKS